MAFHRTIVALLLVSLVAAVLAGAPNDVFVGEREEGDHLIDRAFIQESSSWLSTVSFRKTFTGNNYSRITRVELLDRVGKGKGGTATIINGGPGSTFVTVLAKSLKGYSINLVIEIYGKE